MTRYGLLALVLLLCAVVAWSFFRTEPISATRSEHVFPAFSRNAITRVVLRNQHGTLSFQRTGALDSEGELSDFTRTLESTVGAPSATADADDMSLLLSAFEHAQPLRRLGPPSETLLGAVVASGYYVEHDRVHHFRVGQPEMRGEGRYFEDENQMLLVVATDLVDALTSAHVPLHDAGRTD